MRTRNRHPRQSRQTIWLSLLDSLPLPSSVGIEVGSSRGLPQFHLVGLPSRSVSESKERIRAALHASELELPRMRLVVNLTPAGIPKEGTGLDLAMALAIATHRKNRSTESRTLFAWGELTLTGDVVAAGSLARAYFAAMEAGAQIFIFSKSEWVELERVRFELIDLNSNPNRADDLPTPLATPLATPLPIPLPVSNLREAVQIFETLESELGRVRENLNSSSPLPSKPQRVSTPSADGLGSLPKDYEDWVGIVACGGLSTLLLGPPGTGKSHTLEWLSRLVPEPDRQNRLHQILLRERARSLEKKLRNHARETEIDLPSEWCRRVGPSVKPAGLFGSFQNGCYRPGELALANGGALIADEFPEWSRDARESLREPIERGAFHLTRAGGQERLPSRFQFLATGNLCACGAWGSRPPLKSEPKEQRRAFCRCTPVARARYRSRVSGPILDRLDLVMKIDGDFRTNKETDPHSQMKRLYERVQLARSFLIERYGKFLSEWEPEDFRKAEKVWASTIDLIPKDPENSGWRFRKRALKVAVSLEAWSNSDQRRTHSKRPKSLKFTSHHGERLSSLLSRKWLQDDLTESRPYRQPIPLVGYNVMR